MSVKDLFEQIVNVDVLKECDEMFIDPNCLVSIYSILSKQRVEYKFSRKEVQNDIVTKIQDELLGYDLFESQILFIYDLALEKYIENHSKNNISLNSLYAIDIKESLKHSFDIRSTDIM